MATTPSFTAARRRWLAGAGGLAAMAAVSGCGFEMRKVPELGFKTIALKGFVPRSPMLEELRLNLASNGNTVVVESMAAAQVVFEALLDQRERVVTANTAAGQVRTFQLRVRLRFQLRTPGGSVLLAPSDIFLARDMSYSESIALAKEQEEAQLYRTMQSDIVAQVMRRLATVVVPPPA